MLREISLYSRASPALPHVKHFNFPPFIGEERHPIVHLISNARVTYEFKISIIFSLHIIISLFFFLLVHTFCSFLLGYIF